MTFVAAAGDKIDAAWLDDFCRQTGGQVDWLATDIAVDIYCRDYDVTALWEQSRAAVGNRPYDVFVQLTENRRKKLLVADMESTIIEQEMLDELADKVGIRDRVADITRRAMNGELDFQAALCERVMLLKGLHQSLLTSIQDIITFIPGAEVLVATMRAHGARCWLVSGGFTCFADGIGRDLGFDRVYANRLLIADDEVVGQVADPILDKAAKREYLKTACREYGISLADSLSVGDGANDVPMLQASIDGRGLGIAYHAKPNVRAVIPYQVNYGDLTALLYAQGYKVADIRIGDE